MVPLDHVLALAVLLAPLDGGNPPALPEHACLAPTLRAVAVELELLDRREAAQMLGRVEDFAADVELLRRRYRDLADAPPLADAMRFPCREQACELLSFNRAYHRNLVLRKEALGGQHDHVDDALAEADQLYRVWDAVRDARSEFYYISVRRAALASLRQLLGDDDYSRGILPPHVPVWRFERRD